MNSALLKGLVALVPACMLFFGSVVLFFRRKEVCCLLQLPGKHTELACIIFSPLDRLERKLRSKHGV
jgi:hypothetical protein